jgi:hypothetical protein
VPVMQLHSGGEGGLGLHVHDLASHRIHICVPASPQVDTSGRLATSPPHWGGANINAHTDAHTDAHTILPVPEAAERRIACRQAATSLQGALGRSIGLHAGICQLFLPLERALHMLTMICQLSIYDHLSSGLDFVPSAPATVQSPRPTR